MSEKETVAVTILDKEYLVASPEEEKRRAGTVRALPG